ncbi:ribbon-helix-helix domain-containing protein [Rhizobium wuzhouense]|uniref:Type II toxin-antitoxin system ParD family antitoxin n=1 Tax=Rhizobium wuzhouense TaxID=1986026 RepID=A0ABX5NSQ1_9HYPH|nr:type II toxin-antitoxin system ParD family antitoxin [Rhizobium wuzhouense]PYB73039.1 type II toxin-antitoxin system ParD family antitoxin [Rhizobium wuzhouense]
MKSLRNETLKAVDDLVEVGGFASADEAVLAAIEAWHQTADDPAQQLEAIRLRVRRSIDDPRPSLSMEEVDAALDEMMAEARPVSGRAAR